MSDNPRLLFLCTGNSCRSQMAEGICRHYLGATFDACSAGLKAHGLNRLAVRAMTEIGIDISTQHSKTVDDPHIGDVDYVITVCGHANETCPLFPARTKVIHRGFDDPPQLARNAVDDEAAMVHYRRVRDEIKAYVLTLPQLLAHQ